MKLSRTTGLALATLLAASCGGDTGIGPAAGDGGFAEEASPACVDADGDAYGASCQAGPDCDDENAHTHPEAVEACNENDDNCDGVVDEGCPWAKRAFAGWPVSIAALPDGSSLVAGRYWSGPATFGAGEPGETTLPCTPSPNCGGLFLARYAPSGALAWARLVASGNGEITPYNISAHEDGTAFLVGKFGGMATFGSGEPQETVLTAGAGSLRDVFVVRCDPAGNLDWARSAGGPGPDEGIGVAALADGGVLVTGFFDSGATFGAGEPGEVTFDGSGLGDAFLAKYDASGALAWVKQAGGAGGDGGTAVAALADGSSLVAGAFFETATFGPGEPGEVTLIGQDTDIFVARFDPVGTLQWVKRAGSATNDWSSGIVALSDGTAFVTGNYRWTATFGAGEPNETVLTAMANRDVFVARYGPAGDLAWAKRVGAVSLIAAGGIAALADGTTFVTGEFDVQVTFAPGEAEETTLVGPNFEVFVARYSPTGSLDWARQGGGPEDDGGQGIDVLQDGSALVTGFTVSDSLTFDLGVGVRAELPGPGIFVARFAP